MECRAPNATAYDDGGANIPTTLGNVIDQVVLWEVSHLQLSDIVQITVVGGPGMILQPGPPGNGHNFSNEEQADGGCLRCNDCVASCFRVDLVVPFITAM